MLPAILNVPFLPIQESSRYASGQSAWCVMHGGGGILFSGNTADTLVRVGRQLEQAAAICQHIGVQCSYRRRPAESCPLFIPSTQHMPIDFIP